MSDDIYNDGLTISGPPQVACSMYVDSIGEGKNRTEWSFMMMDTQLVIDFRDSLKTELKETDRRLKNACANLGEPNAQEVIKKLSEKTQRLKLMLELIEKEFETHE